MLAGFVNWTWSASTAGPTWLPLISSSSSALSSTDRSQCYGIFCLLTEKLLSMSLIILCFSKPSSPSCSAAMSPSSSTSSCCCYWASTSVSLRSACFSWASGSRRVRSPGASSTWCISTFSTEDGISSSIWRLPSTADCRSFPSDFLSFLMGYGIFLGLRLEAAAGLR